MVELADLQPGQKLRIQTENEVIIGSLKKLVLNGKCIEVLNPHKLDGTPLGKIIRVFECDIVKIEAEKTDKSNEVNVEEKIFNPTITKHQRNRLLKKIEDSMYINQADMKYFEALREIEGNFLIGVHAENVDMGRLLKAEFLQIATSSTLYVFDLYVLDAKRLFKDLQAVFESDAYLKIMFDSRLLLDNFNSRYNLKLSSVCDLLVVMSLQRSCEIKSLNDCMEGTFGFNPSITLKHKIVRPIEPDDVKVLSSKVAYLIPLYTQLNQLSLIPKFGDAIDEYSKITKDGLCCEITAAENIKLASIIHQRARTTIENSSISREEN